MMVDLFTFLPFSSLMLIYANGVVWCPAFMKVQVIWSIIFFTVAAFSPAYMTACLKSSSFLIKQVMISLIFTDYKNRVVLFTKRVMNLCSCREWSSKYLFGNKNMLKDIAVICAWMLRTVNLKIARVMNSFPALPGAVFVNKTKRFSPYPSFAFMVLCCQFSLLPTPTLAEAVWDIFHGSRVSRKSVICQQNLNVGDKLVGRAT